MLSYILATIIGLTLGLLGGGGSILTVPVLVYILKIDPKTAIALSLGIVGLTSLFGSFKHFKNIQVKAALIFAPFAMIGSFSGAKLAQYLSSNTQLLFFSIIMIIASIQMLKKKKSSNIEIKEINYLLFSIIAVVVGIITGIVGVGGGFLIVPALTVLGRIPIKKSIGTSLFIIFLNSSTGFLGYYDQVVIDWNFMLSFSMFSIVGVLIGSHFMNYIPKMILKKVFAYFLIIMGIYILFKNLIF